MSTNFHIVIPQQSSQYHHLSSLKSYIHFHNFFTIFTHRPHSPLTDFSHAFIHHSHTTGHIETPFRLPNRLQLDSVPEPYIYPLLAGCSPMSKRHCAFNGLHTKCPRSFLSSWPSSQGTISTCRSRKFLESALQCAHSGLCQHMHQPMHMRAAYCIQELRLAQELLCSAYKLFT